MNADTFSKTLLELYHLSRTAPMAQFQRQALDAISARFDFDTAWWGMASINGSDLNIHSALPYRLPATYGALWEQIKDEDLIAKAVLQAPGTTVNFNKKQLYSSPGLASLMARFGITSCLCTVIILPELQLVAFASMYRMEGKPAFSESERRYVQLLMPHMTACLTSNWMIQLERARAANLSTNGVTLAVIDKQGLLYVADLELSDHLRREWPNWVGPFLPDEVVAHLHKSATYQGSELLIRFHPVGDLWLVDIRPSSDLVRMSPRETIIARRFADGLTYKEVARELGIAPSTARHYLREIYIKLNVSDKAELARKMQSAPEFHIDLDGTSTVQELPGVTTTFDSLATKH